MMGTVIVVVLFIVMLFVIGALLTGGSIGDGVVAFFSTILKVIAGAWNFGS